VLLLETPFYEHSQPYPGRIADYPPGVRENGAQYSHGATWIIDGFMRLALSACAKGDAESAARLYARAFEIFEKISPMKKTDPENIAIYGLIPIQQPADIYEGWGHGGRGGWSWYTGSAARMLSAAYACSRPKGNLRSSRCASANRPGSATTSKVDTAASGNRLIASLFARLPAAAVGRRATLV
jgi:hypothetical protein